MKKRLVQVLIWLLTCFSVGFAQNPNPHYTKARNFMKAGDIASALPEARMAVAASRSQSVWNQAKSFVLMSNVHTAMSNFEGLMDTVEVALELPLENHPVEKARLLNIKGGGFLRQGKVAEAKQYLLEAISIVEKTGVKDSLKGAFNKMGVVCSIEGDSPQALYYLNEYLDILERSPDSVAIAFANVNIGSIHVGLQEYEQAEKNFRKAMAIQSNIGKSEDLAAVYRNLSSVSSGRKDYIQAKLYLDSALHTPKGPDLSPARAITLGNIATVYQQLHQPDLALTALREKISMNESQGELRVRPMNDWQLAELLDLVGHQDSVEFYYQRSIALADSAGNLNTSQQARNRYWQWLREKGRFEEALTVYQKFSDQQMALKKKESERLLARERARFEVMETKSELKDANAENLDLEETNTLYVGLLFALGFLFVVVLVLLWQLQKTRKRLQHQNSKLVKLIDTKNKFFGIIAHDIRSPLVAFQNIGKRIQKAHQTGNSDKVNALSSQLDESATQLNGLLNNLLSWALLQNDLLNHRPQALDVQDVILDNLDLFSDLAQMKNINLESKVEEGLKINADEHALHLMIRNLISNAIKFTPEGGLVTVRAFGKKKEYFIQVQDNGLGVPEDKLDEIFTLHSGGKRGTKGEKGVGLGLHLVSELMSVHGGKAFAKAVEGNGSTFTLQFQT